MASYEQITRRLTRLEAKRISPSPAGDSHAEEIASLQRVLATRDWSEPVRVCYQQLIAWHEREIAQGRLYSEPVTSLEGQEARARLDAKFTAMLSRLPNVELDALRIALEQEVAEHDA